MSRILCRNNFITMGKCGIRFLTVGFVVIIFFTICKTNFLQASVIDTFTDVLKKQTEIKTDFNFNNNKNNETLISVPEVAFDTLFGLSWISSQSIRVFLWEAFLAGARLSLLVLTITLNVFNALWGIFKA